MLLQLHNKFQLGIKYTPFCLLENNLTAQALFVLSARAEITWTVCRFFSPFAWAEICPLGPVSRKSRELFVPEKPFVKLRPTYSARLVF